MAEDSKLSTIRFLILLAELTDGSEARIKLRGLCQEQRLFSK